MEHEEQKDGEIWFTIPPCKEVCYKKDCMGKYIKGSACPDLNQQTLKCEPDCVS